MKNKFLTILIILLGYNSSKITAMEIENIKNNEYSVNFVIKNLSYKIDTNNQIIKAAIDKQENMLSSNIDLKKDDLTTGDLHDKYISRSLPHIFLVDKTDPKKLPTILIPENLFFSTIIYRPDIENKLNGKDPEKINIKELDQYITDSDNGVILLTYTKIATYIKNSITLLTKKKILKEKYLFDIEDLVAKMLDNTKEIEKYSDTSQYWIWENRKYFILFILQALKKQNLKILNFTNIQNRLYYYIEHLAKAHNGQSIEIDQDLEENMQTVKLNMDMDLFINFFVKQEIINEIYNIENYGNSLNQHLTQLETYILKKFIETEETNKIEDNQNKTQLTIAKNNYNYSKEFINIISLLITINDIRFACYRTRENDGGEATKWGTHSNGFFKITKQFNQEFLLPFLNTCKEKNINDSPKIPTFLFLNYPEQ
jgi:hypothetical protein